MNTHKLLNKFYSKSQEEIANLTKNFIEKDFFAIFPELKNKVGVLISGSVASGFYDKESDIDLNFIFYNEKDWKEYKIEIIKKYKGKNLESLIKPFELHGQNITFLSRFGEELESWKNDWMLREFFDSMIIYDPKGKLEDLKIRVKWYPEDIYKEKMNWLFAETTFQIFDRYENGLKRGSLYFTEMIKLNILRLFLASLIMANVQYPTYDKHLFEDVKKNKNISSNLKKIIGRILLEKNSHIIFKLLVNLRNEIEKILIAQKIIPKKGISYWHGARPKYRVEIAK